MYKHCVAQVNVSVGVPEVSFYAYRDDMYGIHRVSDWNDPDVLWYESGKEAMKHRLNANDCVLSRYFEEEGQ